MRGVIQRLPMISKETVIAEASKSIVNYADAGLLRVLRLYTKPVYTSAKRA